MCIIIFRVIGFDDDVGETPSLAVLLCFYVLLLLLFLLLLLHMKISVSFFFLLHFSSTKTGEVAWCWLHFEHVTSEQGISRWHAVYLYNLVSFFAGTFVVSALDDDVGSIRRSSLPLLLLLLLLLV